MNIIIILLLFFIAIYVLFVILYGYPPYNNFTKRNQHQILVKPTGFYAPDSGVELLVDKGATLFPLNYSDQQSLRRSGFKSTENIYKIYINDISTESPAHAFDDHGRTVVYYEMENE